MTPSAQCRAVCILKSDCLHSWTTFTSCANPEGWEWSTQSWRTHYGATLASLCTQAKPRSGTKVVFDQRPVISWNTVHDWCWKLHVCGEEVWRRSPQNAGSRSWALFSAILNTSQGSWNLSEHISRFSWNADDPRRSVSVGPLVGSARGGDHSSGIWRPPLEECKAHRDECVGPVGAIH